MSFKNEGWGFNAVELSRRAFLKTGISAAAMLWFPHRALSAISRIDSSIKTLRFYNTHTEERVKVDYFRHGKYQAQALETINHILRDHRTGEIHPIDPALLDLLFGLQSRMRIRRPFYVISGYRSQATNIMLAQRSSGVAKQSMHTKGKAIDIRIPGIRTKTLRNECIKLQGGGVGYYPESDFVHLDIGRIRWW